MVDPINSGNIARLRATDPNARHAAAGTGSAASAALVGATDNVSLSTSATTAVAHASAAEPPFNADRVAEIKNAIAQGNYPLDAERVAESFFKDAEVLLG